MTFDDEGDQLLYWTNIKLKIKGVQSKHSENLQNILKYTENIEQILN